MYKTSIIAFLVIILTFGCQDEQLAPETLQSKMVIKTGTICGWCSLNDTLSIHGNVVRYVNYTQCNNTKPAVERKGSITSSELDGLLLKLDFQELKKLDLNSCNVCVDGCDDWIYFDNGTESHFIRFTRNDPKLQPIKNFMDQLNAIKTTYAGNH